MTSSPELTFETFCGEPSRRMGNLCCCWPSSFSSSSEEAQGYQKTTQMERFEPRNQEPLTERDYTAQNAAAAAAAARQQKFESSPVGRAAYKTETAIREKETLPEGRDTAQDWLS